MGLIVIFGGTFNPIHIGHRQIIDRLSNINEVEKIILIPTKIPPHKQVDFLAAESDRVNMCKLIASKYHNVEVSTIELKREGKSYTVDTLMSVQNLYPDKKIAITIGADMVVTFDEWKDYRKIIENSVIITFARIGTDRLAYALGIEQLKRLGAELLVLEDDILDVSSTQIRDHLSSGTSSEGLLDREIYDYICNNNVYEA